RSGVVVRPSRGPHRCRLSDGHECRRVGWPDGRSSPYPPARWPVDGLAPGMRGVGWLLGIALLPGVLASCGIAANEAAQPSVAITPQVSLSATLQLCRNELVTTLSAAGFSLVQAASAVRPAESPLLTTAPRTVGQVLLPADPDHGFIVLYQFPNPASAYAAAQQQAAYIGGGEGRIQF